jgi:hypothetical protein
MDNQWCPFINRTCGRIKGSQEALADVLRENRENLERAEKLERALESIRDLCPDDGSFRGGGISDLDDLSYGHRAMSKQIHRIASITLAQTRRA